MKVQELPINPPTSATYEALTLINEVVVHKYDDETSSLDHDVELRLAQTYSYAYYGIIEGGTVLAAAICEQRDLHTGTATVVWDMGVRPDQQRRGLGIY